VPLQDEIARMLDWIVQAQAFKLTSIA